MLSELPPNLMFMKVGNHAYETLDQILVRKQKEGEKAGRIFWGYGGAACHPTTQVQPFARLHAQKGETIFLAMEHIDSKANPDVKDATQYSEDGRNWLPLPDGVTVTGSKYAVVMKEIVPGDLILSLHDYRVGVGASKGKDAMAYLQGRTDKGCLSRRDLLQNGGQPLVVPAKVGDEKKALRRISLLGRMVEPYAVFVR